VYGLRHEAIQRHLLSEADISYAKAMGIASAMEVPKRLGGLGKLQGLMGKGKDSQVCYWCNICTCTCTFKEASCHDVKRRATLLQPANLRVRIPHSLPSKATGSSTVLIN